MWEFCLCTLAHRYSVRLCSDCLLRAYVSCVYQALISIKYINSLGGNWLLFLRQEPYG